VDGAPSTPSPTLLLLLLFLLLERKQWQVDNRSRNKRAWSNGINTVAFAYKKKPPKKEMRNTITILQTNSSQFFFHCNFPQTLIFFFSFPF
jgi:hypothetical protein